MTSRITRGVKGYTGRAIYLYAYDIAYEMTRQPVTQLLGQPVAQFSIDASRRNPRHLFFFRPQMVRLPPMERIGPNGLVGSSERSSSCRSGRSASPFPCRSKSLPSKNLWLTMIWSFPMAF